MKRSGRNKPNARKQRLNSRNQQKRLKLLLKRQLQLLMRLLMQLVVVSLFRRPKSQLSLIKLLMYRRL